MNSLPSSISTTTITMTTTQPSVLVLALLQERVMYPSFSQLTESMAICATVIQVETKGEFGRIMRLLPPTVIVAINAGTSKPENAIVLSQPLQYTKEGGITICCCNFSNHINGATARSFFSACGLPWYLSSYFKMTVQLNRAATGVSLAGLLELYNLNALLLLNAILSRVPLLFSQLRRCARRRKIVGQYSYCCLLCQFLRLIP